VIQVKVCGITRVQDALLAARLGAFAVGFVFWPGSPRCVSAERARAIVDALPPGVLKVGVFVNQPVADVHHIATAAGLDLVQLHGDEGADYIRQIDHPVIKAVAVSDAFQPGDVDGIADEVTVLLDAHDPVKRGGTGRTIDWSAAASAAARRRVILSGGITAHNIRAAVDAVQPFAIDVSSGVERSPGEKDPERMRALFDALHHG
jgi:phosphoribosylanthranilate isomerase